MALWQKYSLASNLSDALQTLSSAASPARLIAGGTDLLLDLQQGRCPPVHTLVDVSQFGDATACQALTQDSLKGAIALVQYFANTGISAVGLACKEGKSILSTWQSHYLWTSMTYLSGGALAAFASKAGCGYGTGQSVRLWHGSHDTTEGSPRLDAGSGRSVDDDFCDAPPKPQAIRPLAWPVVG